MDVDGKRRRSIMWKYFTRKNHAIATCNRCKKDYSHKASITNLAKHWRKCHAKDADADDDDDMDTSNDEHAIHSDDDTKSSNKDISKKASKSTWQYFDVLDNDKFAAKCKVCELEVPYDSVSDLREHAREHDAVISDDEAWGESTSQAKPYKKRSKSKVWKYMRITDGRTKIAACGLCQKKLSFSSTMNNLRKHLQRVHPRVDIDDETQPEVDTKKMMIDGQIYEVATSDGEKDPIQMDEIYLDDSDDGDILTNLTNGGTSPPVKIARNVRRRVTTNATIPNTRDSFVSIVTTDKNTPLNTRNVITNVTAPMGTIDYFGQYVVSLLKELPKHVAGQLQSDIIKQIFTTKIAFDTPYSVTSHEKPVTITVDNDTGSISEVTVHNTDEVMKENNEN